MVNQDTVSKQEEKLQTVMEDIRTTDEDYQTEQVLNLQLSNEHNTLMTDLSHILNQRNSLLLECEGLRDTVSILHQQIQEVTAAVQSKQHQREEISGELRTIEEELSSWKETSVVLTQQLEKCMI